MLTLPLKVSPKAEQGAFYSPISSTTSSSVAAALKAFHERNAWGSISPGGQAGRNSNLLYAASCR